MAEPTKKQKIWLAIAGGVLLGIIVVALASSSETTETKPDPTPVETAKAPPEPVEDSQLTRQYCNDPDNFDRITPRQQAICGSGGINPNSGPLDYIAIAEHLAAADNAQTCLEWSDNLFEAREGLLATQDPDNALWRELRQKFDRDYTNPPERLGDCL